MHWIGGMGVLVFVMAFLPLGGAHNLHIMRAESTGPSVSKLVPRVRKTAIILYGIYIALTVLQTVLLLFGNMSFFEAINTAFSTAGTGGFGFRNDSMNSFSSSVMTFAGQNYGAMKRDRINKVLIYSIIQVTAVGILIAQLELLFAYPLASMFVDAESAAKEVIIEQAILVMNTVLTFYFLCGIYGVLAGFIRGLGNSVGPMITAVSTVLIVRSVWIYVFFPMHADRIDWLLLCYPITWIITIIMNLVILAFTVRKLKAFPAAAPAKSQEA